MKKRFFTFIIVSVFVGLVVLVGGILTDYYVKQHLVSDLVNDYSSQEQTIGNEVALSLSDKIDNIENSLYAISLDPAIQSSNPAVCNPTLETYYSRLNLGVGNLGRVNNQGIFYCTINKALLNKPASALGTYVQQLFNDPKHNPVMSNAIQVPGVSGYVVAIHVPVYSQQHAFLGTIGGAIYLDQLDKSYLSTIKFAQTGHASLQDDNGTILYSHVTSHIGENYFSAAIQKQTGDLTQLNNGILAARRGVASVVTYDIGGVKKIASITPLTVVPNHRWIVLISVPESQVETTFIHSGLNDAFDIIFIVFTIAVMLATALVAITSYTSYKLQLAKDQFVSLVSHQLRTPLTAIRLFSEMMISPEVGPLNPKQREYAEKIHLSCVRMINLVGDILNVSRIDLNRLKVTPEKTDIEAFILSKIEEMQPLADEKHVVIRSALAKSVHHVNIDQTLFGQVIHNLLTNAVRYSPENTGVVIVDFGKQRGDYVLTVSDNGIGIPTKARKKVFHKFYRADNAVKAAGDGTGLGLYMLKMIMKTTGGDVWYTSSEGHGTKFYVKIPHNGMQSKKG